MVKKLQFNAITKYLLLKLQLLNGEYKAPQLTKVVT